MAGQIANAKVPSDFKIIPYRMMLRKDDPQFKTLVDKTISQTMTSDEIEKIYTKWFMSPIPPKNVNLQFPVSPALKEAFKSPNDKGV